MSRRPRPSVPAPNAPCPCGRGLPLAQCCGPLLEGEPAPTPEHLMRSRYTAFALGNAPHLLRTWHRSTRPATIEFEPARQWTGLEVLRTTDGSFLHSSGTVEFRAHWITRGVRDSMHEHSRFVRQDGDWVYVDALDD